MYSPYKSAAGIECTEETLNTGDSGSSPNISPGHSSKGSQHDPFVTKELKLSATASSFNPTEDKILVLNKPATNGSPTARADLNDYLKQQADAKSFPAPDSDIRETKYGTFTTDTAASRSIKVSEIYPGKAIEPAVMGSLETLSKVYKLQAEIQYHTIQNVMYLHLDHIEDAFAIYNAVKKDHLDFAVEYISSGDYGRIADPSGGFTAHEGQILLSAPYPDSLESRKGFEEGLRGLLAVEGQLHAWKRINTEGADVFQLIVEYADATRARRTVARFLEKSTEGTFNMLRATVTLHSPVVPANPRHTPIATPTRSSGHAAIAEGLRQLALNTPQSVTSFPRMGYPAYTGVAPSYQLGSMLPVYNAAPMTPLNRTYMQNLTQVSPFSQVGVSPYNNSSSFSPLSYGLDRRLTEMSPSYPTSPFNRSFGGNDHMQSRSSPRRPGMMSPPNRGLASPASGPHNTVEADRILAGGDVRTTVMLRNIPNKINQAELKMILDTSSFGKYDFAYLRIDFSNNCNVGYAFINFADPLDIIPFVHARSGQRWSTFKTDKVAEVSYATIQGRDCLIQKFRNSSVMAEAAHCRPKLFYTDTDPFSRAGQEEDFPPPDNLAKLKRSCENAEHIGLYAPSAGAHFRDEQRRRRSQFDRGTTLADRDDHCFDDYRTPEHRRPRYNEEPLM